MNLIYRKGTFDDVNEIVDLYDAVNDFLTEHVNYPGWKKGVYPAREDAVQGIEEKSLFVATIGKKIVSSFILRNKPEEAYYKARWRKDLSYDKVYVIYTFVVHPDYSNQGIGSEMLRFITDSARKQNMESIRLDVYSENLPAIRLYERNGFEHIATVDLGLEKYGLKWFELYEKLVV